jgi:hypothetical protein
MGKKIKIEKEKKENNKSKKNIYLSHMIRITKHKRQLKNKDDIPQLNPIQFRINENPLNQEDFEKEYYKRQIYYLKEEFSYKIFTMFFNYISSSSIIPIPFKNNRYFIKEFLKIIMDLLINEIDFATITLIFDNLGWINQGSDPWPYINYICLYAKEKSSSKRIFTILLQIFEKKNEGFEDSYNKWVNNINNKTKLKKIGINDINQRFKELTRPIYLNENHKKFINYNEIADKIVLMSKNKDNDILISTPLNPINYNSNITQNNIINQQKNRIDKMIPNINNRNSLVSNNNSYGPGKENQQQMLDMKNQNSSFIIFDLNAQRSGSGLFRPFDVDLSRTSSFFK